MGALDIRAIIEPIMRPKVTSEVLNRSYNLCLSPSGETLAKFLWWNWTIHTYLTLAHLEEGDSLWVSLAQVILFRTQRFLLCF